MSRQIHSRSVINIPFSWENKPGISKTTTVHQAITNGSFTGIIKLPPPPCPPEKRPARASFHGLQIPLPPCAFMSAPAMKRDHFKKGNKKMIEDDEDPFLLAYKECTKSGSIKAKGVFGLGKKKKDNLSMFSCKKTCSVRDDSIVRISQLVHVTRSRRRRDLDI